MNTEINNYLDKKRDIVNDYISRLYTENEDSGHKLFDAVKYSLTSGGKRIRPILCLAACEYFSGQSDEALGVACAIEMVHSYSLIHDDLPSMDDDDLRRGRPTNHIVYGEATAILAGDALLTDAFDLLVKELSSDGKDPSLGMKIMSHLTRSIGSEGMILGQAMDLFKAGSDDFDIDAIKRINYLKTGALIEASLVIGGLMGGAKEKDIGILRSFSNHLGLSFQITDDILDVTGGKGFGKTAGSDARNQKPTYASVLGTEKSMKLVKKLTDDALSELDMLTPGHHQHLREITKFISERTK